MAARIDKKNVAISGVALVLFIALAVYTWTVRSDRNDARQQVKKLEGEKNALNDALELHRTSERNLDTKLNTCTGELKQERIVVKKHDTRISGLEVKLSSCKQLQKEVDEKLADFKAVTAKFRSMIDAGSLDVVFRRGQMVVKLPAAILFPSGKAELSKRGDKAISEVAKILRQLPRRRFLVTGHTDSLPLGPKDKFKDNWDLSTARALAVTKLLIKRGVRPWNLVVAGRSMYEPVASNRNRWGRQRNRRIEIVLRPYLRKPPKELEEALGLKKKKAKRGRKR